MYSNDDRKQRVFSGIQPSGRLHIGNYAGAINQWLKAQDEFDNLFCVVDLHALTNPDTVNPLYLKNKIREVAALFLACGINPDHAVIFQQSQVHQHAELAWLLSCATPIGWLERMTQFKAKVRSRETASTGLFEYPVLMAADILLYQTDIVPVGDDQKQHLEITRDIAQRFNSLYGDVFKLPTGRIGQCGARIMALDNPTIKMSKSLGESIKGHSIGLLDKPAIVRETIMKAVTDSAREVRFAYASPGVKNLLVLYKVLSGQSQRRIENHFMDKPYSVLKDELLDMILDLLNPIQKRYQEIMIDAVYLDEILRRGKETASRIAEDTMTSVKKHLGIA